MTPETTPRGDVSPVTWWLVGLFGWKGDDFLRNLCVFLIVILPIKKKVAHVFCCCDFWGDFCAVGILCVDRSQ